MTAKRLLVVAALILIGMVYYQLYKDRMRRKDIEVFVTMRPKLKGHPAGGDAPDEMVVFQLGSEYKLTALRVLPLSDVLTNKYAHAAWELISESNSIPTSTFGYGYRIRGMHPSVKGATPDPLLPGTGYRVQVQSGSLKGQHDFTTPGEAPQPEQPQLSQ